MNFKLCFENVLKGTRLKQQTFKLDQTPSPTRSVITYPSESFNTDDADIRWKGWPKLFR